MHHCFLYISNSLPSLHDYDVKVANFAFFPCFFGGREHKTTSAYHLYGNFGELYYYMRNFYNLIGLEQWYFSLI